MIERKISDYVRLAHEYTVTLRDDGAREEFSTIIPAGTVEEQDAAAELWAEAQAQQWAQNGEWGDGGCVVIVRYTLRDAESEWAEQSTEVDIPANQNALISAAGGDTSCPHEWTREGHGGCKENLGVHSDGGTAIMIGDHCTICGLHRVTRHAGSQRNPHESEINTIYTQIGGAE